MISLITVRFRPSYFMKILHSATMTYVPVVKITKLIQPCEIPTQTQCILTKLNKTTTQALTSILFNMRATMNQNKQSIRHHVKARMTSYGIGAIQSGCCVILHFLPDDLIMLRLSESVWHSVYTTRTHAKNIVRYEPANGSGRRGGLGSPLHHWNAQC